MGPEPVWQAKERAVRFLAARGRTAREVAVYLERRGFPQEVVREVLGDLERYGYVDDARFAADRVRYRSRERPVGRALLEYELLARGVPRAIVEETLRELLPEEKELEFARRAADRYLGSQASSRELAPELRGRRLGAYLAGRGFPDDIVRRVVRERVEGIDI